MAALAKTNEEPRTRPYVETPPLANGAPLNEHDTRSVSAYTSSTTKSQDEAH